MVLHQPSLFTRFDIRIRIIEHNFRHLVSFMYDSVSDVESLEDFDCSTLKPVSVAYTDSVESFVDDSRGDAKGGERGGGHETRGTSTDDQDIDFGARAGIGRGGGSGGRMLNSRE